MGRRMLLVVALVLVVAAAAPLTVGAEPSGPPGGSGQGRPNIVVIMTDDQTVESLRVMGQVQRRLVREGTSFANSFVGYPLCCPSRATFLTGQYPHNHGVLFNSPPTGGYERLDGANTLPVWLRRAGYHTAHIGKYLNGYGVRDPREVPPGWSEWYATVDPSTYNFYGYTVNHNGRLVRYGRRPADYQTDVHARRAVELIGRRAPRPQPFFLSLAVLAPHTDRPDQLDDNGALPDPAPRHQGAFADEPLPPAPAFNEADVTDKPAFIRQLPPLDRQAVATVQASYRARLASLLAVDDAVGAVIAALQRAGELDDTVVILTSDNGYFHGEHRIPSSKYLVYEEAIRVPLVVRGPGVARGATATAKVANIDLAPTIVELAGAVPGRRMDGRSLRPLLAHPGGRLDRDLLIETFPGPAGDRLPFPPSYAAIRTDRYLYAEHATGELELYDLHRDPWQLASGHADPALAPVRAELAERLAALRRCAGASCG
jgi:N-acetylglucosamine-6-sulfatase